jgi:hypothetical protein
MKSMSAALVTVALLACPAAAEERYQSMMSGDVTIKVVPVDAATGASQPQSGENLTVRFVPPPKPEHENEDGVWRKLRSCGKDWDDKLHAHNQALARLEKYIAYYEKWRNSPAQRPPKPPEPDLTRASYRACMYQCLGDRRSECTGGWPKTEAKR